MRSKAHEEAWPDARVQQLTTLFAQGLSRGQIARTMKLSRNSIIGKVLRLKLTRDTKRPEQVHDRIVKVRTAPVANRGPVKPRAVTSVEPTPLEIDGKCITLLELKDHHCKWPVGDPTDKAFHFCGLAPHPGRPYCPAHCAKAYTPMSLSPRRVEHRGREK